MARRSLHQVRALITGASSGIGWHLALQLASLEGRLVLCARRKDRLDDLVQQVVERGGRAVAIDGDITDSMVRMRAVVAAERTYGGLDALINNAGIGAVGSFVDADPERLRTIMEVNFFAPAELIRISAQVLARGQQPIIVNVGSVLGHRAMPLKSEYCASKFAMHGFSDALRAELARQGIDVLLVSPNSTDSEFFDRLIENTHSRPLKLRRAAQPEWVAKKIILAMKRGRHEVILSGQGKLLVWFDRIAPALVNRAVSRWGQ